MRNQRIQAIFTRVKTTFDGFTRGQRAVTIIAIVVAIVGGIVFYNWASQPAMAPLYTTQLSQSDAAAVTSKLTEKGISYQLNGTQIMIPRDKVDQTRLDLAADGLPSSDSKDSGYSLVANAPLTTSDAQQRILVKQATEDELKKAILKIDTVQDATVQLALPEPDVFTRDQVPPKASVIITPKANQTLTDDQVQAIVHLVSSAIPKLDPNNVTVTDSSGQLLSQSGTNGAVSTQQRAAQQAAMSTQITQSVQTMLDKAVGAGNSSVSVRADLNYDNTKIWRNEYVAPPKGSPALQTDTTKELYKGSGQTPVGGVLGPDNIPVPSASSGASGSNYTKESAKAINAVGNQTTYTEVAQGAPKRVSVSVLVDSRTAGAINQAQLTQALSVAAGLDPKKDQISVVSLPFDQRAAQAQAAAQAQYDAQKKQDDLIALGKNIGLGLLILLALLIGFRQSRKRTRIVELGQLESVEGPVLPELPGGSGATAAIESGRPAEFALDGDDEMGVLEATPIDPQSQARVEARQEITQLVEENPDEVARLLRGWMSERK